MTETSNPVFPRGRRGKRFVETVAIVNQIYVVICERTRIGMQVWRRLRHALLRVWAVLITPRRQISHDHEK